MKSHHPPFVFIVALLFLGACNLGVSESVNETGDAPFVPKNLYEGAGFSIEVTGFDIEERKTTGEIRNGYDKPVRELKGYLYFLDEQNEEITFATGAIKREPFQRVQNPFIVDGKRTTQISFGNRIDKRAKKVHAVVSEITFTDGTTEVFD